MPTAREGLRYVEHLTVAVELANNVMSRTKKRPFGMNVEALADLPQYDAKVDPARHRLEADGGDRVHAATFCDVLTTACRSIHS